VTLLTFVVFAGTILLLRSYSDQVQRFGDSKGYMAVAAAIRHWNFQGLQVKQFWGYSYFMAALSLLTGLSDLTALLAVSVFSSLAAVALAHRLWGGWVATWFAIINFDWMQRSLLGGSEPLFVALLFGAFLSVRRGRWRRMARISTTGDGRS